MAGVKVRSKVKSKVDPATGERGPVEVVKFASAHDLRRSFGERWASRVMPKDLMELMRHESIGTTMRFYVGQNAERTADAAWAAYEAVQARQQAGGKTGPVNTSVNSQASEPRKPRQETTQALVLQGLVKSGRQDSNLRPSEPHSDALARLRHAPKLLPVPR